MKPNELEDIAKDIAEEMRKFRRPSGKLRVGKWMKHCNKEAKWLIAQLLKRNDLFEEELKR